MPLLTPTADELSIGEIIQLQDEVRELAASAAR